MQSRPPPPTHARLSAFLSTFLPSTPNDLPFLYHTPRHPSYHPSHAPIHHLPLALHPSPSTTHLLSSPHTAAFLHRPFGLPRRAIHRGNLVLASHTSFDAALTVGYNVHLASRLGLDVARSRCVQGYKGDPERRIGIVGRLARVGERAEGLCRRIGQEFEGEGEVFLPSAARRAGPGGGAEEGDGAKIGRRWRMERGAGAGEGEGVDEHHGQGDDSSEVRVLAIMNAFHAEEVERVIAIAVEEGWTTPAARGSEILYLTGAARPYGLEAVAAWGMPAMCVGHVACERWGIRFLAERVREEFPGLDVQEIYEEEEEVVGQGRRGLVERKANGDKVVKRPQETGA
ncbi:MAG: hypothetical protein M1821_003881 [Bathelium mastoideum]|nr:MAG: hypothetical protein M1821_003881 [Bathelium mastoideum]